jgi:hypothetical protein
VTLHRSPDKHEHKPLGGALHNDEGEIVERVCVICGDWVPA